MEYQAMERESQGYEENSGRMRWIIDKGLALGKKMLITGFVISSAPVVLPPLMFISAVGVACSVPYGLFLASYACTEKIMSKLLPIPKTPLFVEDSLTKYEVDSGFRGKVEMKNEDEVNALKGGLYAQKEFEVVEKNGYEEDVNEDVEREKESSKDIDIQIEGTLEKEKEEPLMEKNKDAAEEICGVMIVIEGMEKNVSNTGVEEVPFEVTNVAVELCQGGDNKDNEELVRETRGLIERIRDEGETDTNVKGTVTQLGEGNAYGQKIEENGDKLILLENVEVKAQLQPSSIGSGTSEGSELEHAGISDQAPYSEEIIWKQIDAMRTIVGHTAARQGTYTEELKALYIFTGVEPPVSFKDSSDLAEVSDKLRFLMSIVGVK